MKLVLLFGANWLGATGLFLGNLWLITAWLVLMTILVARS
jgi:hypothetical protein